MKRHSLCKHVFSWGILGAAILLSGCASTYTVQKVSQNPLPSLAQKLESEGKYRVKMTGDDHLELRDTWTAFSIMGLGPYAFESELDYRDNLVYGRHHLQANGLWTIWLPVYLDAGPGFVGAAVRPAVRKQKDDVLERVGGEVLKESHSGFKSLEDRVAE